MINVQHLRGNSSTSPSAAGYTGPIAELVIDTDIWGIRVQDGSTPGGHLISPTGGGGIAADVQVVSTGTSYTVSISKIDTQVVWRSTTAGSKTTHIPPASSYLGYRLAVKTTLSNGDTHNIVPTSGTIDANATISFSDTKANIPLYGDANNNDWLIV